MHPNYACIQFGVQFVLHICIISSIWFRSNPLFRSRIKCMYYPILFNISILIRNTIYNSIVRLLSLVGQLLIVVCIHPYLLHFLLFNQPLHLHLQHVISISYILPFLYSVIKYFLYGFSW